MRIPRIHAEIDLAVGTTPTLPVGPSRHLAQVLRLGPGAPLILFNGDGFDYAARILSLQKQGTRVAVESVSPEEPQAPLAIHLALGISKGERMDYALQKAVELGVGAIRPLFTERSQVRLEGDRLERRLEHWNGIVVAACEQSGRRRLPRLETADRFESWLASPRTGSGLLLDPTASVNLTELERPATSVNLLIGPEGGLSPRERERAGEAGFQGVRLGPRILRTETAPLAAIAVIQALWGDFRAT
ncbi:16S rRNA (uracil(1498)-N(3))-methyltransferase [Imhoffiella purpurea]|uniref:Ribosomal RNA small subunit methyltransferase E n=1 Tax=Imhoffiella purpurea TaxID=1249627 RepID=W9VIY6_9GAMM|nr:16S rRNA (uracil(1498)-N(3))-methyltransferase [Imhoffiella purpurea]EXJ16022.1 Ribosomal RNA small subunit methyltransferase E [Imhoffiella purpurea]